MEKYFATFMYMKYNCQHCAYKTNIKRDYERHLKTNKHVICDTSIKHVCSDCNFVAYCKADWQRHLQTRKHKNTVENNMEIICDNCNKRFKHKSGLSRHKQSCNTMQISNSVDFTSKEIAELFGQQQNMMSEIMAKVSENCSITNITNNNTTTTNKFNLNIFLNETCKNAMTLEHFLNNLQIEIEDIEYVGTHGYVEGMTHIITERLNALDITERPIHCTDVKRETMHIKGEDAWHKDVDDEKINSLVGIVAKLNYRKLPDWREQHPHFLDSSNPDFDYHLKMLGNILGPYQNTSIDKKVVKNIAKHTILDKQQLALKYV